MKKGPMDCSQEKEHTKKTGEEEICERRISHKGVDASIERLK